MFFPVPIGGFGAAGGKASVSIEDNTPSTADATEYTFSDQAFGAPTSNRKIVVVVHHTKTGGTTVSTLTAGGINASLVVALQGTNISVEIWQAVVPTGTTGDVVVTLAAAGVRCGVGVFRVIGGPSAAHATASNADDPMAVSIAIPSNGVCIGGAGDNSSSTYTWTNLTEGYDEVLETSESQTGASVENAALQTPTITCNPSNAAGDGVMVLASWAPV